MMHGGRASRRSYAVYLGYHLGKVLGYERLQDYPWDDMPMAMDTDGFEWTVLAFICILVLYAVLMSRLIGSRI